MWRSTRFAGPALAAALAAVAPAASAGELGLGRPAAPAEIAAWDIDVRPDGEGLPEGRGSVAEGERVYDARCAACHGDFGEGTSRSTRLAGGRGTLAGEDPVRTIGSFWPALSTVYDYVRRSMPFGEAQSLAPDELYAVTAYLLFLNDLVPEDFTLTRDTFAAVTLPNAGGFVDDDRPDTATLADGRPCMVECRPPAVIVQRAGVLAVTPDEEVPPATR